MGRYDHHTWVEREDFSSLSKLKFPEHVLIEFFKSLLEIAEAEGIGGGEEEKKEDNKNSRNQKL